MSHPALFLDRAGLIRPDLIPLAAFLCAEEYGSYARSIILDHAAAGAPLAELTEPTPDGWVALEPHDLAEAEEALRRGGPAPRVEAGNGHPGPASRPKKKARPAPAGPVPPAVPVDPAVIDDRPTTLAEIVDHEALAYCAWGTPEGEFLARQMERLAQLVRWTGAATPGDHEDRMEVWDDDLRKQWEDRGYEAGYAAGRREGRRLAREEMARTLSRP